MGDLGTLLYHNPSPANGISVGKEGVLPEGLSTCLSHHEQCFTNILSVLEQVGSSP